MGIKSWPDILRGAGVSVSEDSGWKNKLGNGALPDRLAGLIWHHDASPAGDSPGALDWIRNAYAAREASAQIWVNRKGVWHFIGAGVAWHTGAVLSGMPNNYNSVGIETDQTVNEDWPFSLLDSLRRGTAAIAKVEGYNPDNWLHFHKTICSPPGRKSDPWALVLSDERARVRAYMEGSTVPTTPVPELPHTETPGGADPKMEDDPMLARRDAQSKIDYVYDSRNFIRINDKTHWDLLKGAGFVAGDHGSAPEINTWDIEWIRGQVLAWGGHADEYLKPGN